MMCMDGIGPELSNCSLICGIGVWFGTFGMAAPMSCINLFRVLLHSTQFCIRRQVRYPPYGPWEHVPPHV